MVLALGTPGIGRDETYWDAPLNPLTNWDGMVEATDILFLACHPDDEVLGCGGLLQKWNRSGKHLEFWMATDGEACHGKNSHMSEIAKCRRSEAREAHRRLVLEPLESPITWLGLPDGEVSRHGDFLYSILRTRVNSNTVLVAPMNGDGHPDHDTVGEIARSIAMERNTTLISYPIWFWHWGRVDQLNDFFGTALQYSLSASEQHKKREAIAAFESQIMADKDSAVVLPKRVLRHFRRPFEVVFREDFGVSR